MIKEWMPFDFKAFLYSINSHNMSKVSLTFDTDIAKEHGVNAAIILQNIEFWQHKNEANLHNFFEGRYWIYNSSTAWIKLFTFLTEKQIRTAISKLEKHDLLISGTFNKQKRDRTKWYSSKRINSITPKSQMQSPEKADATSHNGECHVPISADATSQNGEPLPVIKHTVIKPIISLTKKEEEKTPMAKFSFFKSLIDLGAEKDLANDWLKVRKTKKATNSENAFKLFHNQVLKSGKKINEVLTICIEKDWKSFNSSWSIGNNQNPIKQESNTNPGGVPIKTFQKNR